MVFHPSLQFIITCLALPKNHSFIDSNKRTALGVMEAFLGMNNHELNIADKDLENLVLDVTSDRTSKLNPIQILQINLINL